LEGVIGAAVHCQIYEQRPSVCREFVCSGQEGRASLLCDRAREFWGMLPLLPMTGSK